LWGDVRLRNSRSHSSKNCMAYDEIADLILELTIFVTLVQIADLKLAPFI